MLRRVQRTAMRTERLSKRERERKKKRKALRKAAHEKKTRGRESKSEMETGSARRGRDTGGGSDERRKENVSRAMPSPHVERRTVLERERRERDRQRGGKK